MNITIVYNVRKKELYKTYKLLRNTELMNIMFAEFSLGYYFNTPLYNIKMYGLNFQLY